MISAAAASADRPASLRPFTATITSPAISFARAAGEESNTRAISRPLRLESTWTPMPVKRGGWLKSAYSRGVR